MYNKILALLLMIFLHIVDDYNLQGILASMKQKHWWEENAPDKMYKNDYKMALFMHGFSWSFMIMLVPFIYAYMKNETNFQIATLCIFIVNMYMHIKIDNEKANKRTINLIIDQSLHLTQIIGTWFAIFFIGK